MAEECPHGDDPHTCQPCARAADQGHGAAVPTPRRLVMFRAKWTGNCAGPCGGTLIMPGDPIATNPDGDGVLCQDCAREATR